METRRRGRPGVGVVFRRARRPRAEIERARLNSMESKITWNIIYREIGRSRTVPKFLRVWILLCDSCRDKISNYDILFRRVKRFEMVEITHACKESNMFDINLLTSITAIRSLTYSKWTDVRSINVDATGLIHVRMTQIYCQSTWHLSDLEDRENII